MISQMNIELYRRVLKFLLCHSFVRKLRSLSMMSNVRTCKCMTGNCLKIFRPCLLVNCYIVLLLISLLRMMLPTNFRELCSYFIFCSSAVICQEFNNANEFFKERCQDIVCVKGLNKTQPLQLIFCFLVKGQ